MRKLTVPSVADVAFMMAAPVFAIGGALRLTQSDGDLAGHIGMGQSIIQLHQLPVHSLASYTVGSSPLIAQAWLSEVIFAMLFAFGGLPLISVVAGLVIGLTHSLIAQFLRRRNADPRLALVAALTSLILGASHWLARPHMFSIVGATLTLFLLESTRRRRELYFIPLFAIWANLHGGWLFGLLLIAAYGVGDLGEALLSKTKRNDWLSDAKGNFAALMLAAVSTLLNPYGSRLYGEVLGAVTSPSLSASIDEYLSPNFHEISSLPFLAAVLSALVVLTVVPKRLPLPWLLVILMSMFFGMRAGRNIALFGVTAIPLLALHIHRNWPEHRRAFPYFSAIARLDSASRPGLWSVPVAALLLALGLNRGHVGSVSVIADHFDGKRFPVEAVRQARLAQLHGRIFHPWTWGGYFLEAWPGGAIFVDPLKFSEATIRSHTRLENMYPGWQQEMARWNIELAVLEPQSRLARGLAGEPGWSMWYHDGTAVIFRHAPFASSSLPETR